MEFDFGQNFLSTVLELKKLRETQRQFNEDLSFRRNQESLLSLFKQRGLGVDEGNLRQRELENLEKWNNPYVKYGETGAIKKTDGGLTFERYPNYPIEYERPVIEQGEVKETYEIPKGGKIEGEPIATTPKYKEEDNKKLEEELERKLEKETNQLIDKIIEPDLKPRKPNGITEIPPSEKELLSYRKNIDKKIQNRILTPKMKYFVERYKNLQMDAMLDSVINDLKKGKIKEKDAVSFKKYLENRQKYYEYLR